MTSVTQEVSSAPRGDHRGGDWHLLSRMVVRRTGFPFDWLEQLSSPDAEAAAGRALDAEVSAAAVVRSALDRMPSAVDAARARGDRPQLRRLSKIRRALATGALSRSTMDRLAGDLPVDLVAEIGRVLAARADTDRALAAAREAFDADLPRLETRLREMLVDPLFAEALFLTNPEMFDASLAVLLAEPDRPVPGQLARRGWAYLQRLAGKNDTASFFGPLNYASVVPSEVPVRVETSPGRWRRRDIFIAYWAASAMARVIAADPGIRPWLRPRPHPMSRLDGVTLLHAAGGSTALPGALARILRQANGTRTVLEIAEAVGSPVAKVLAAIDRLAEGRAVILGVEIPSTRFHPFAELRRLVGELPKDCERAAYWNDRLAEFDELRRQFRDGDLGQRRALLPAMDRWFVDTTGVSPRRGAGATYADRMLFYEDCEGTHSRFEFSNDFTAELLNRLSPILDLSAAHASLLTVHYRRLGRSTFDDLAGGRSSVPYAEFSSEMLRRQRDGLLPSTDAAVESLRDRLRAMVQQRSDGHVAQLSADDLATLIKDIPVLPNCHVSPDIMISAPDIEHVGKGDYSLVLGEVHQVVYAWGSQLFFDDQKIESERECEWHVRQMPDYDDLAVVLTERRHKGLLHESFPGTFIEVSAIPSARARARVAIADTEVIADGDGVALCHRETGQRYRLYMAGDEQLHLWAAALPRVMPIAVELPDGHTPRITLDRAVYQRERWVLQVADCEVDAGDIDDVDLLRWGVALRRRFDLPRFVYVSAKSEPKPYYVDFAAPLALRVVRALALVNERLTVTEMLPGPDGLWLREDGRRFCGEFRMTAFRYRSGSEG